MVKQKKRIVITGAQGTGKTTLANVLGSDGTKVLSIARETAIALNWTPENGSSKEYQKALFKNMLKGISSKKSYISDRGLTCVAAHTYIEAIGGNIPKKVADDQFRRLEKFHAENPDILVVYVPIEFNIEEDGIRNADEAQQAKIDFLIKNILDTAKIPYITVTGSVEERVAQVNKALENR